MKMLRRMLALVTAALLGLTAFDEVTMDVSRPPTFAARAALGGASPAGAPRPCLALSFGDEVNRQGRPPRMHWGGRRSV